MASVTQLTRNERPLCFHLDSSSDNIHQAARGRLPRGSRRSEQVAGVLLGVVDAVRSLSHLFVTLLLAILRRAVPSAGRVECAASA